jgi:DegV family protein with EDD domain
MLKKEGQSLETIAAHIEGLITKNCGLFTVDELGTLLRGGRISLTKALLGTLLNAKPALKIDLNGKLVPFARARGKKNAILVLLNEMERLIEDQSIVLVAHSDSREEAERIKDEISKRHPDIPEIVIGEIGPVIGAHTGPGAVGIFFIGKER